MKTLVKGGWIVGYADGTHVLIPDGVVVFEDTEIIFVGQQYEGSIDTEIDASDKLVAPGFIDTHVHAGHRASHRLISDSGRPDFFGLPMFEIGVAREGTVPTGDPRYQSSSERANDTDYGLLAEFTVVDLLRNGITTFVEFGAQRPVQEALLQEVSTRGIRAYLGPGYDSARWVADADGRLDLVRDEETGWRDFDAAVDFVEQLESDDSSLARGILVPRGVDTCTVPLLQETARVANKMNTPVAVHAAYHIDEFILSVREHHMTPIEVLEHAGLMGPMVNVGHGQCIGENPLMNYSGSQDLTILGTNNCSVSHCPVNHARRGRFLDHWSAYHSAGVNMTLGSDSYPRDMIMQMRTASYLGKVLAQDFSVASAAQMFDAATLGAARSLGRTDIGRLTAGAKADIVVIDLKGRDSLRYGPIYDPIKSLVECGIGDDVVTVIVDGVIRVDNRSVLGSDLGAIRDAAQSSSESIWANTADWDPLRRTARQKCPTSYPLWNE